MGAILYFIETTLLWIVALAFLAGLSWRLFIFVVAVFRKQMVGRQSAWQRLYALTGVLAPFHRAILKKPLYAALRYVFHACLFIVPVWFSGHIDLWEDSRFEWYWTPLPDVWADRMTLVVLATCVFFMIRRAVFAQRLEAGFSEFLMIGVTALPFVSGYFLTHGTLSDIAFFDSYLWYLHVISGEAMLLMIVCLFCRTRLNQERCVGCAACVENCPTGTLEFYDEKSFRHFNYSHYQCICCGACVNVCPERAAALCHEVRPSNLINVLSRVEIRQVQLKTCQSCGVWLAPVPQMNKITGIVCAKDIGIVTLDFCRRCKNLRPDMQNRSIGWPQTTAAKNY